MAKLEKKGVDPVLAAVANWFVFSILGYILIGQTSKGVKVLITIIVGLVCCWLPGVILAILAAVDVYQVAKAVNEGEEIDEHEYMVPMLYKFAKIFDKEAICKAAPPAEG